MKELLNKIVCQALDDVAKCADSKSLTDIRVKFLGKNGEMTSVMKGMGKLSPEERPAMGKLVNEAREKIENAIAEKDKKIKDEELALKLSAEAVDVTLPSKPTREVGSVHPLTRIKNEIIDIFKGFGFSVAEGPEIETDYFNFQLMNVPKDHPARDMQDTFYIDDNILLRTHTSPMQARIMTTQKPPIRVVVPGKVYRSDDDASHSPIFNQIEGLAVDKKITLGDLQGVLTAFAEKIFSKDTKTRFRPSYFPFTEPSVEMDVTCSICGGKGCRVCKDTGWVEILGAGVVNPHVLDMCGLDSNEYSGFAFGFGVERIAMLKYAVPNIKMFYENDVRFLKQFNKEA
ncbi:phenylalanine--tRNA ligase alpha subunit [Acidaminococcus sp. CAG:917]|nr:phenylalanine--tRNA ligase alpha subunit [Acidaminococcus sp. CAG:917]